MNIVISQCLALEIYVGPIFSANRKHSQLLSIEDQTTHAGPHDIFTFASKQELRYDVTMYSLSNTITQFSKENTNINLP